jgi:ketosteroid isomerase-like protein
MKKQIIAACLAILAVAAAVQVHAAGDEQTLRDLDAQWSAAAASKNVDKTVSYYSDDAMVLPPNGPTAATKDAVRKVWNDALTAPGVSISWKAVKVEVSKSGDLACVTGTYEYTMNDASGKPVNDKGKYVEVWEKKGGTWKCGVDIWNSDLPAAENK